jgi:hypothetical protein
MFDYQGKQILKGKRMLPKYIRKTRIDFLLTDSFVCVASIALGKIYFFDFEGILKDSVLLKKKYNGSLEAVSSDAKFFVVSGYNNITKKKRNSNKKIKSGKTKYLIKVGKKRRIKFYKFPKMLNRPNVHTNRHFLFFENEKIYVKSKVTPDIEIFNKKGRQVGILGHKSSRYEYVFADDLSRAAKAIFVFSATEFAKEHGKDNFVVFYPNNFHADGNETHVVYQKYSEGKFSEMSVTSVYPLSYTIDDKIFFFKPIFPQALLIYQLK